MHIYKDAQCNEFCTVLLMGFWVLFFWWRRIVAFESDLVLMHIWKKSEWHMPGIREIKDTESQGTEWILALISSCHLTCNLLAYWIPKFSILAVFVLRKSVVSMLKNNSFPSMHINNLSVPFKHERSGLLLCVCVLGEKGRKRSNDSTVLAGTWGAPEMSCASCPRCSQGRGTHGQAVPQIRKRALCDWNVGSPSPAATITEGLGRTLFAYMAED